MARLGSVKKAALELDVSEAAVSLHVGKLRKLFDDPLFSRTATGLAFTPGGLRLAGRAAELIGLQDRTVWEALFASRVTPGGGVGKDPRADYREEWA